jgi:TrmH family RNA methyltransferase
MHTAILVEPEIPENTGFIARLAANFDFSLRVVNPDFNLEEARKTAKNAQGKLRDVKIFDSVEDAIEDLDYVVGTKPERGKPIGEFEPSDNTSVMIGRESSGLSNEELSLCDAVVHIETSGYSSLNQSHAAGILFHKLQSLEDTKKKGIEKGQITKLEQLLPKSALEAVLKSNPERKEAGQIIGDLKNFE